METKLKAAEAKAGRPKWWRLLRRPHIDGGEGEKEDEGKKDAGEFDSQSDFSRDGSEAWIEESDEGIGEDDPDSDDEKEGYERGEC